MEPILVPPMIYVLELENKKWYIGITYNLNIRLAQHIGGSGAQWTKLHKPIRVAEVFYEGCNRHMEDEVTKKYIMEWGKENVRGGSWCKV